jgi:hypothetical protein
MLRDQNLPATMVFTSSANAIVPKSGSEAYDVSKAAVNHLIRELAIGLGPLVRVNGIAPATVVAGSSMFPRDRVMVALKKYRVWTTGDEICERNWRPSFGCASLATADPAAGLRERHLLARRRRQRRRLDVIPVGGGLPSVHSVRSYKHSQVFPPRYSMTRRLGSARSSPVVLTAGLRAQESASSGIVGQVVTRPEVRCPAPR